MGPDAPNQSAPGAPGQNLSPHRGAAEAGAPAISFIVPLFNCLDLTRAMLDSLRATLPRQLPHEIILIDDGSVDGTRSWLATLREPPFRVLLNERNVGYAVSNNRASAIARGRLLCLLNNDLILPPGWFEPLLSAHRALGRRAGLVGNLQLDARTGTVDHAGIRFTTKAKPEHDRRAPSRYARWFRPVRRVPAVTAACVLTSSDVWRQLGGFDEGFVNGGEDIDLCFRARAAGLTNAVALRSIIRHHVSSSPGRKLRDEANSERLAQKWRHEFVRGAARGWCREYLPTLLADPRNFEPGFARRIFLYAVGLGLRPPRPAVEALERCLDLEFIRWSDLRKHGNRPAM